MLRVHVYAACPCPCCISLFMQHSPGNAECPRPCCMSISMLHANVCAACPGPLLHAHVPAGCPYPCCTNLRMQHGHGYGHAAWTWICIMDRHAAWIWTWTCGLDEHAAWTWAWTCSIEWESQHVPVHAASPCPCSMPMSLLHVLVHAVCLHMAACSIYLVRKSAIFC